MATQFPTYAVTTEGSDAIVAGVAVGGIPASDVNVTDTGTLFTATDVEAALAEVKELADTATQPGDLGSLGTQNTIAVPTDITATGTASGTTFLRGDGAWATPAGSGITVSSGAGAPASTPAAVGDIYIDTTGDNAYLATGTASAADWQQPTAVATYSAGWPTRPQAEIVFWLSTDTAATAPGAATGDDIVILAQDADLTAIAALTSAADKVPYSTGAQAWALADFTAAGRALVDDADASAQRTTLGLVIGTNVQAYDADTLKADTADTLTAGFDSSDFAAGTKSTGTYTPAASDGNFQVATNGGAHTLAPPSTSCSIVIHYPNNGSAGAITTTGFTIVTGDAFTTTDTHEFVCVVTKINDVSVLNVSALQ